MFEIPKNKHLPKESFYVYFILRILRTFGFFDLKVFKFFKFSGLHTFKSGGIGSERVQEVQNSHTIISGKVQEYILGISNYYEYNF